MGSYPRLGLSERILFRGNFLVTILCRDKNKSKLISQAGSQHSYVKSDKKNTQLLEKTK